jgi:hypothetical protein
MLQRTAPLPAAGLLLLALIGQSCHKDIDEMSAPHSSPMSADATVADYATYTLQCQVGNKFVQVAGDTLQNQKFADGAPLQQAGALSTGKNGAWQQWSLVYRTSVGKARYYQVRNLFSGKLLSSPSNTDGAPLVQQGEAATLADQQLWQVSKVDSSGASRYRLLNKGNGLAVTNHNASTSDNTTITQEKLRPLWSRQCWAFSLQAVQSYRDDQVVRFFERNDLSQGSMAFDGGVSIPLSDGRVLWTTSDAYDGQSLVSNETHFIKNNNWIAYRNTALMQPTATNWNNLATPNLTDASRPNNWTTWYARSIFNAPEAVYPNGPFAWPYAGIEVGNHVYVQAGEGNMAADAATQQQLGQTGQAIYDLTEAGGTNWAPSVRIVPNGFGADTPCNYNAGMVKGADGYIYAYGATYNWGDDVYVARFQPNADSVRTGWRYWNGTGWAKNPSKSSAAIVTKAVSSTSVSYVNGKYVAISMDVSWDCDAGKPFIFVSTSTSPTGPFSPKTKVYSIAEYQYGKRARAYCLHTHPQAVNGRNELLITYSMIFNDGNCAVASPSGLLDPYFYRLKGVRIPYSLMGL